ncbi:MBL fold metallo-hydrolase [Cerasicoccus frondis]|uniref:MBL fold metallo-hydrolase n=1 Tax=Cerasicoccus frondis TaxID=490090 RepID=UPI0028529284|nr:MBL fold metallo-hydrolase [Cerasicoccus frondis]
MRQFITLLIFSLTPWALQAADHYQIVQAKDNVYRFTAGHYHATFMVTDEGIFVADPINQEAATWLSAELKQRFDVPVRYLAYSHSHVDHTLGGEELANNGVTVIAHELAAQDLLNVRAPTAEPDITFNDELTVQLGDSWVEMRYYGVNNGRGSVSFRYMPANVLFVVDWIIVGRMPYKNLLGYDIQGMINSTQTVLNEPAFDLFIGGHADMGSREDVVFYLGYLQALYAAVRDGMLQGKDLETLQTEIKLPDYANLRMYDEWLPDNIAGVYTTLRDVSYFNFRPDIDAAF